MNSRRPSAARFALALTCVFTAMAVAQEPPAKKVTKFGQQVFLGRKMPDVRWQDYETALVTIRRLTGGVATAAGDTTQIVIAQSPEPGATVFPNTPRTITLGKPKLLMEVSNRTPLTSEDVGVKVAVDPPLPPTFQAVSYHYAWGDGAQDTLSTAAATHRFKEGQYSVTAYAVIGQRWQTDPVSIALAVAAPPPRTMPDVRWLDYKSAEIRIRELVGRVAQPSGDAAQPVMDQSPDPGVAVLPDAPLTITLATPRLQVKVSNPSPKTNEEVSLDLQIDPPPPLGLVTQYHVVWGDGREETVTSSPARHAFADARTYDVIADAVVGQWRTAQASASVSVAAVAPPPPKPEPKPAPTPTPAPRSFRWLTALIIAAVVLAGALIVRAFKPSPPAAHPAPVSFRHGLGNTSSTIENAEGLRGGVNVRLRSGVRSMVVLEGGSDV